MKARSLLLNLHQLLLQRLLLLLPPTSAVFQWFLTPTSVLQSVLMDAKPLRVMQDLTLLMLFVILLVVPRLMSQIQIPGPHLVRLKQSVELKMMESFHLIP
jgi:hypothetical protein